MTIHMSVETTNKVEPLDELYLTWLYSKAASPKLRNPSKTYWTLFNHMYKKEFVWFVPNDDNRVGDGVYLRHEFLESVNRESEDSWMGLGCSFLEMVVALSYRCAFDTNHEPRSWFWKLLEHLDLEKYNDNVLYPYEEIDAILDRVIWRTYDRDGKGGLFPLNNPRRDQRNVEIWYQMNAYFIEHEEEYI
jgi:hypothetical protein